MGCVRCDESLSFQVSSKSALTHNGGGDSNSIANMVTWAISQYKADASKVYVTGSSSGAMMTVSANISIYCLPTNPY